MFLQTERVTKKDLLQISPNLIQNKFALLNVKVLCTVCLYYKHHICKSICGTD